MTESEGVAGTALNFPASDSNTKSSSSSPPKLPRRLRRRLLESKSPSTTVEEIEAKLKEADLRRQQFYELMSSKARPKLKSPSWSSSQEGDLGQQLKAKLNAAEQKRLSILAKVQKRLARLDEMRQAAKIGVEMRFEKERDELGMKVESRVQQAEANRMLLLTAHRQRRAAKKEQTAQSLMQRLIQESKYKECVRAAIHRKRAAAEKKRSGLLEAEKSRAHARGLIVRRVANSVYSQREIERRRLKDQLEDRLQRAKKLRAEYLRQRGSLHSRIHANSKVLVEEGEFLSRKLARCWKRFVRLRGTTFALAKAYVALDINEKSVKLMPFEQLALQIESAETIKVVKALLDRFESRITLKREATRASDISKLEHIDHLLKRVASPRRKGNVSYAMRSRGVKKVGSRREVAHSPDKLSRYPVRVVLCAYMILGHPDAVFSGKGEHEIALAESAESFVCEFELLIKIILDGPIQTTQDGTASSVPSRMTFRSQMGAFDKAWCSYLYRFVVWKVKDAKLLEGDLVRAACQMELSMMQTCKRTPGDNRGLTHAMKVIQKQVTEDQMLLREKVQHLSGSAGLERMKCALSETQSRFFKAKENGSSLTTPAAHRSSPSLPGSSDGPAVYVSDEIKNLAENHNRSNYIVRSLFKAVDSSPGNEVDSSTSRSNTDCHSSSGAMLVSENEVLVNEIVHEHRHGFADSLDISNEDQESIKAKVRETMEKAFWDGILKSMKQDEPDYNWVLKLMMEVRDELCDISPSSWRQEIVETIDIDILSQVLKSGSLDMDYLGKILEFSLLTLHKLSAPANEDEVKTTHHMLLQELGEISQAGDKSNASFALLMMKGLRFVLRQIQALKHEISKARIRVLEPLIKGPAGLEYLQKAFTSRYGSPTDAPASLPLTTRWLSTVRVDSEPEWGEYIDSLSALRTSNARCPQGLPSTIFRTGGSVPMASKIGAPATIATVSEQPECKGEKVDLLLRLCLLKLVSEVEGLTVETMPETLKLNLSRLRTVQSQLQKIIVISTSILVLRQTLLSEKLVTSPVDMENIVSRCVKRLSELLDSVEDVGISEIIETINGFSEGNDPGKLQARKEVMANMLAKSLRAGDAIFTRVSRTIYLAARGVVLGGSGVKGRELAEMALKRVGAALLTEKVVEAAEVLVVVATVTGSVHGAWYDQAIKNI
uniref:T-complex protein 11 n=1 Tax=Davidia involucrata TaxID=16924 RepID=A0A5B7BYP5_DAVIN